MRITTKQLQLRNLGQLAAVTVDGKLYMGRLDSVIIDGLTVEVTIGGVELVTEPDYQIEIRRTPALDALVEANWINTDMADLLEEVADNAS